MPHGGSTRMQRDLIAGGGSRMSASSSLASGSGCSFLSVFDWRKIAVTHQPPAVVVTSSGHHPALEMHQALVCGRFNLGLMIQAGGFCEGG